MKKILFTFLIVLIGIKLIGQTSDNETIVKLEKQDSVYVDTLNKNLLGLNIYSAFSILGGGRLPNSKLFLQYKRYFDKSILRTSINYINFYKNPDFIDILGIYRDTLVTDTATIISDSIKYRKFYYDIYTVDYRIGYEAAFANKGYRFFIGGGLILGYHFTGENYYHYKKKFEQYPVQYININPTSVNFIGNRKTHFLKLGADITIGVDITISNNCVITLQYAPEIVYYHKIKETINDPDNYFKNNLKNGFNFLPDYVDLVLNIRF